MPVLDFSTTTTSTGGLQAIEIIGQSLIADIDDCDWKDEGSDWYGLMKSLYPRKSHFSVIDGNPVYTGKLRETPAFGSTITANQVAVYCEIRENRRPLLKKNKYDRIDRYSLLVCKLNGDESTAEMAMDIIPESIAYCDFAGKNVTVLVLVEGSRDKTKKKDDGKRTRPEISDATEGIYNKLLTAIAAKLSTLGPIEKVAPAGSFTLPSHDQFFSMRDKFESDRLDLYAFAEKYGVDVSHVPESLRPTPYRTAEQKEADREAKRKVYNDSRPRKGRETDDSQRITGRLDALRTLRAENRDLSLRGAKSMLMERFGIDASIGTIQKDFKILSTGQAI